jgi:hypothetical protein
MTQLDESRSGGRVDMEQVGRLLVELADDEEFFLLHPAR